VHAEGNRGEFDQYKGSSKGNDRPAYLQFRAEDTLIASRKSDLASEPPQGWINLYSISGI
jgi:hypothetical protein